MALTGHRRQGHRRPPQRGSPAAEAVKPQLRRVGSPGAGSEPATCSWDRDVGGKGVSGPPPRLSVPSRLVLVLTPTRLGARGGDVKSMWLWALWEGPRRRHRAPRARRPSSLGLGGFGPCWPVRRGRVLGSRTGDGLQGLPVQVQLQTGGSASRPPPAHPQPGPSRTSTQTTGTEATRTRAPAARASPRGAQLRSAGEGRCHLHTRGLWARPRDRTRPGAQPPAPVPSGATPGPSVRAQGTGGASSSIRGRASPSRAFSGE